MCVRVSYNASYFNLLLPIESNLQKILGKFIDLVIVLAGQLSEQIICSCVLYIQNFQYLFYDNIAKTKNVEYEIFPFILIIFVAGQVNSQFSATLAQKRNMDHRSMGFVSKCKWELHLSLNF